MPRRVFRGRDAVDDLLDGHGGVDSPIGRLVEAARAPAQAAELSGLDAALAVFTSDAAVTLGARSVHVSQPRHGGIAKFLSKLLGGAGVVAVAAGGAALAGGTTDDTPVPSRPTSPPTTQQVRPRVPDAYIWHPSYPPAPTVPRAVRVTGDRTAGAPSAQSSTPHGRRPEAPPGRPGTSHGRKPSAPPGQSGKSHGRKPSAPPGQSGKSHGRKPDAPPGQSGKSHGRKPDAPPGQSGKSHGRKR